MKKVLLIIYSLLICQVAFAKKFEFTIHNSLDEPIEVYITEKKKGKTKVRRMTISPGTSSPYKVYLKGDGDEVRFNAKTISNSKNVLGAIRTYNQLVAKKKNDDSSVTDINLVEFSILTEKKISTDLSEAIRNSVNSYLLESINDKEEIKLSKRYGLGSFVLFKNGDVILASPATNAWKNDKTTEEINRYDDDLTFRIKDNEGVGASVGVSDIGSISGSSTKVSLVDHMYSIYNYREKNWIPENNNPQAIFKMYKDQTGYNELKTLMKSEISTNDLAKRNDYKVLFISTHCITDSIRHYSSNYASLDRKLGAQIGLPLDGQKVVQLGGKYMYMTSESFIRGKLYSNVLNYFKVMDITTSCMMYVTEDIAEERKIDKLKVLESIKEKLDSDLNKTNNLIVELWEEICKYDFNDYNPKRSLDLIKLTKANILNKVSSKEDDEFNEKNDKIVEYNKIVKLLNEQIDKSFEIERKIDISIKNFNSDLDDYQTTIDHILLKDVQAKRMSEDELNAIFRDSINNPDK